MENVDHLRLVVKVARLYHTHGRRQSDIASRLQVSQSRVSRLLAQAEEAGIVRTVVTARPEIHSELEEQVEERYELQEVHVFDAVSADDEEFTRDLAHAMAAVLDQTQLKAPTIGFTSWSRTQRQMVDALQPLRTRTERVVEMLGDLGPPDVQHAAARSTQVLAALLDAEPVFLRTPGVVPTPEIRELLLSQDGYAREALALLDDLDMAFVGIGSAEIYSPLRAGENYFTEQQLADVRAAGAVGQVCLRFLDADGGIIASQLDDMVVGVTSEQLRSARRRWAVAGGPSKYLIIRAALRGGWIDSLVTDAATARFLLSEDPDGHAVPTSPRRGRSVSTHGSGANTRDELCEGTGTNVFVLVEGRLLTPPLSSGCLAGITRELVLEITDAAEVTLPYDILQRANEVFLTSSTREVQAVAHIDGRPVPNAPGPITTEAAKAFRRLVATNLDP